MKFIIQFHSRNHFSPTIDRRTQTYHLFPCVQLYSSENSSLLASYQFSFFLRVLWISFEPLLIADCWVLGSKISLATMPENLLGDILESLTEGVHKHNAAASIQEEISNSVNSQFSRLFGRQRSIHHLLGGGKSADVFLWRNKKISGSVLAGATVIWILFEWLNYNFLTLVCFALILGMLAQFLWANASGLLNRSSKEVPRLVMPEELFVSIGKSVGIEVNRALAFLQDVAVGGNLKQFLVVVGSLFVAAIIGGWFNFLTVLYIGFVAAHTLPVLYERYEDQIDGFVYQLLSQLQHHYGKLNDSVLSRVRTGRFKGKKHE